MKEELFEKVVEVRRKSERVMAMVLAFEKEVVGVICAYALQVGRSECEKDQFYNDMAIEWDLQNLMKWFLAWGTLRDMLGDGLMILWVCMVGMEWAKEMLREKYSIFVMKRSCAWQIHGLKKSRINIIRYMSK